MSKLDSHPGPRRGPSRRSLLTAGLAGLGGAAAGAVGAAALADEPPAPPADAIGQARVPFFGVHQAGVDTSPQACAAFIAFDLEPEVDREALTRLLRLWTDDAARLTQGEAALADTEGELAETPSRLTVTLGLGPGALDLVGLPHHERRGVGPLPPFDVDRLEDRWSAGDLLLQVCADDRLTVAHAVRMLTKDAGTFGRLRWRQDGFQRHAGVGPQGSTARNLMGQVDGTANPVPGTDDFTSVVWIPDGPLAGGTTLVLRRIRMDLDRWDLLDRRDRELVIGRRLSDGSPLTGETESDPPDLDATDANGLLVIPEFAHVRRAHPSTTSARILRRPYSYQQVGSDGAPESGLLFTAFQSDVQEQFVPVQRSLAELDLLNQWTTPVGSAVFLVPPGCRPGGYLGDTVV
jgi:dye decolorizing peroxidase